MNCPSCGAECPPEHKFCGQCAAPLEPEEEARRQSFEGERRQASVVFSDLSGYTALNERLDPEDVLAVVSRLKTAAVTVVESHGGTVNQFVGDEILALFGIPTAHSDDSRRAIRAAQDLHALAHRHSAEVASELDVELSMHTGIATGLVLATPSDDRDGRFGVTGDTINLAARLKSLAKADEICVDEETRGQASAEFGFEALPTTKLKGKARSVACFRLTEAVTPSARRTRFVGRQPDLASFSALLDESLETGGGQALYVRGEPGIGKTRLVEEFQRRASERGVGCHTSLILDFGGGAGRDAIRALARSLVGIEEGSDEEARMAAIGDLLAEGSFNEPSLPFLNDLLGVPQTGDAKTTYDLMDRETRQGGLRETLAAILKAAAEQQPLLLVIEDLHWADEATLSRLATLTTDLADQRAVLVMTSRIESDPIDAAWRSSAATTPFSTMDLQPLGHQDALELAQEYIDTANRVALACIERAEGNPLFLEQLLHQAEETGTDDVPGSVQSIVLARLDSLPAADKNALQAASVFGQRFSLQALRALIDDCEYECNEPIRHFLVRPQGDELLFSHALIQEGVYASLLRSRARQLHVQAADWFRERDVTLWAQHLDRAGDADAPRAYVEAAQSQMRAYQHDQALASLDRALEIAKGDDEKCDASRCKGKLLHDLGSIPESMACYEASLGFAANATQRCRARIGLAGCLRMLDKPREAFPILEEAEREAEEARLYEDLSELHFLRGNLNFPLGNVDAVAEAHKKALDFARRAGSAEGEARAFGGLGDACWAHRRIGTATEHYRRCVELARENGFGRIEVANLGPIGMAMALNDHREIRQGLEIQLEAIELARRVNAPRTLSLFLGCISGMYSELLLDVENAEELSTEAIAIAKRIGNRRLEAFKNVLALTAYRKGDVDRAVELAEEGLAVSRETGMAWGVHNLAFMVLICPDSPKRRSYLDEGEALLAKGANGTTYFQFLRLAIHLSLRDREWDEAKRYADLLEGYLVEPWPFAEFEVECGRALAAYGQGDRDPEVLARVKAAQEEAHACGLWAPGFDWVLDSSRVD